MLSAETERLGPLPLWLRLLARLPFGLLYAFADVVVLLVRYVVRHRVSIARANLRGCFPDFAPERIESILNSCYRRLGQVAVEFIKLPALSAEEMRQRVSISGLELLTAEKSAGRSVLILAGHLSNWEWQLQGAVLHLGPPFDAAYKPLHSIAADRIVLQLRSLFGARMVAAKKVMRAVARRRHEVHAIALMSDQIPASSSGRHWLTFLGRDTAFYPGPAEIARMTGYMAVFTTMRRLRRGFYELGFHPLAAAGERLEPDVFTARYARMLEAEILADPPSWLWTHRRWKFAPPARTAPQGQAAVS
jgi:KDO2-lipid IV(A) lauroyltransferase